MLQVRNLPDDVHAKLKERAAAARMSLSDYVAAQLAELVSYRSNAEILAHAREHLAGKVGGESAADAVRAIRGPLS
jgi:plasmid stability protein